MWLRVLEALALAAAVAYAVLTYLMWQDSHHNFTIDERAWLGIMSNMPNTVNESTPLSINITVLNTGKTVARRIYLECSVATFRNTDAVSFDYSRPHTIHDMGILSPNGFTTGQCSTRQESIETLHKSQVDDLVNGRAYLAIFGRGKYDDIFGGTHWVQFCVWKAYFQGTGNYNAKSCTDYGDTGDGTVPQ